MTNQTEIYNAVLQGKHTAACWANNFIQQEKGGQDIACCVKKLRLLIRWVDVLERFYCQEYQVTTEGKFECLTEQEAMVLVGKLKLLTGV
jgi:hypothetical protein